MFIYNFQNYKKFVNNMIKRILHCCIYIYLIMNYLTYYLMDMSYMLQLHIITGK